MCGVVNLIADYRFGFVVVLLLTGVTLFGALCFMVCLICGFGFCVVWFPFLWCIGLRCLLALC